MYPCEVIKYDPVRDAGEVVGGLAVNIDDMLKTGIVHSQSEDLEDNGIDAPEQVVGLVRDEFAAIDAMRVLRKYGRKEKIASKDAAKAVEKAVENVQPSNIENHE